ncbi:MULTISPECIES: IS66 family transposase [unclassified Frankia]|uniref:IS66 family transposase n=1 Tax=unclassified Frankia TaxID=2632575 RepID=UPI002AD51CF6|nr:MULTISPECIES: transposase [unclassified Frankia]
MATRTPVGVDNAPSPPESFTTLSVGSGEEPDRLGAVPVGRGLADERAHALRDGGKFHHSLHPAAKKVLATLDREWDGLVRHRDFPDVALDNNPAERALGNPVVGRKNYYGAQAEWAAHLAARVWTITATAERNGREPLAYLTDYLNACAAAGGKAPAGKALEQFFVWLPAPEDAGGSPADTDPPDRHAHDGPAP